MIAHGVPLPFALLVASHIVEFGQAVEEDVQDRNCQKNSISSFVLGCIICGVSFFSVGSWSRVVAVVLTSAVDVGCNDASSLHKHVIARSRDSPRTDRV